MILCDIDCALMTNEGISPLKIYEVLDESLFQCIRFV